MPSVRRRPLPPELAAERYRVRLPGTIAAILVLCSGCDHGLQSTAPAQAGIAGEVRFVGSWPAEVAQVAVAVYREPPASLAVFFNINGWDIEVALGVEAYEYFVPLDGAGVYQWIIVAWRRENSFWDFTSLWGCYHLPDAGRPASVVVEAGEIVADIDIEVDFSALDRETATDSTLCDRILPAELLAELGG